LLPDVVLPDVPLLVLLPLFVLPLLVLLPLVVLLLSVAGFWPP
jgi:hypothetical protein